MKKLTVLIALLALIATLVACGGGNNAVITDDATDAPEGKITDAPDTAEKSFLDEISLNLEEIFAGKDATIYGTLSDDQKAAVVAEAKKNKVDVTFGTDGSTVFKAEGSTVTQDKDGNWAFADKDGNSVNIGGGWPTDDIVKKIPMADFGKVTASGTDGEDYLITIGSATVDDAKEYTEQLKGAGYTTDPELTDESVLGITVYSYSAKNSSGDKVSVTYLAESVIITIGK